MASRLPSPGNRSKPSLKPSNSTGRRDLGLTARLAELKQRYDQLDPSSKNYRREQRSVVNSLVSITPSTATGFDVYGNALNVNESKVQAFAFAQRELNKQALKDP